MTPMLRHLFTALTCLCLVACGTTRELLDIDTGTTIEFRTSKNLNPDQDGRPSPIVIKVFALTDDRQFKREDFLSLYEDPAERLGSDLIESYELKEFSPDESREEIIQLTPETRFIGLMAAYIQYDQADALMILPVEAHKNNKFTVVAERLRLVLADK